MEPDTTDLAGQLSQWTQRLNERQEALQSELQRLQIFRNDYDALEKTLRTLPDQTSRSAMVKFSSAKLSLTGLTKRIDSYWKARVYARQTNPYK